jgi:hypothetical protein
MVGMTGLPTLGLLAGFAIVLATFLWSILEAGRDDRD